MTEKDQGEIDRLMDQAKKGLSPRDIYLSGSALNLDDDFNPKYFSGKLMVQLKHGVVAMETATTNDSENGDGKDINFFRVTVSVGARVVDKTDQCEDNDNLLIKAELTASYIVEYIITDDSLPEEALSLFGVRNVYYHVWPFWREYMHNTFRRANINGIMLPTFQL